MEDKVKLMELVRNFQLIHNSRKSSNICYIVLSMMQIVFIQNQEKATDYSLQPHKFTGSKFDVTLVAVVTSSYCFYSMNKMFPYSLVDQISKVHHIIHVLYLAII